MTDIWVYRMDLEVPSVELGGFDVEATDGHIGKVDGTSSDAGNAHVVVDTGFWIFGKKRVIPARAIKQINAEDRKIFIDMTKDEVKAAPDFHHEWVEPDHRSQFDQYYDPFRW